MYDQAKLQVVPSGVWLPGFRMHAHWNLQHSHLSLRRGSHICGEKLAVGGSGVYKFQTDKLKTGQFGQNTVTPLKWMAFCSTVIEV